MSDGIILRPLTPRFEECLAAASREAADQAKRIHMRYRPFASAHETYGVIAEELAEYFDAIRAKREYRNPINIRGELIDIACAALRRVAELDAEVAGDGS